MTDSRGTVSYILVNNVGGITSMISNLIRYRGDKAMSQEVIFLDIKNNPSKHFTLIRIITGICLSNK